MAFLLLIVSCDGASTVVDDDSNFVNEGENFLADNAKIPILLYHSWTMHDCDVGDIKSLASDLELLHENGWTIVPLDYLIEWRLGNREGRTLPKKVVAVTLDDGNDLDWVDNAVNERGCEELKSAATILYDFKKKYQDEIPLYSPHATTFVIASPEVRKLLLKNESDYWWKDANNSKVMSVQNHSVDHDHGRITGPILDGALGYKLPAGAISDGDWYGKNDPSRIVTEDAADLYIIVAAKYIESMTDEYPTIFAHPFGIENRYLIDDYLPNNFAKHKTRAAMCTERDDKYKYELNFMTKKTDVYCIPRFTFGSSWSSSEGLLAILNAAQKE